MMATKVRDIEKQYSIKDTVAKLRRLADCLESGKAFKIQIASELPLKNKVAIAKMNRRELSSIHVTLGPHIREKFGFWRGNKALMESCRTLSGKDKFDIATGSAIIIDTMWARLRRTHNLRAVK